MRHLHNMQKLLSDFFCRRSKINGGISNRMVLNYNGLVIPIAHRGVKKQSRGFLRERVSGRAKKKCANDLEKKADMPKPVHLSRPGTANEPTR